MAREIRTASLKPVAPGSNAFVVIGMHRSGTSALTRTLSLSGATLPTALVPAQPDNPSGFWELQSIVDLNDEILRAMGTDWGNLFAFSLPRLPEIEDFYLGRAVEHVQREFDSSASIVLKDPRISLLASFWKRALSKAGYAAHFVIMVRNPLEVAESLHARGGPSRGESVLLWGSYMIAAERDTREHRRTFVSYDQLLNDWRSVCERLADDAATAFPRDAEAAGTDIDAFLNRQLRHHRIPSENSLSHEGLPDDIKSLYHIFSRATQGAKIDRSAMDAIELRFAYAERLVGPAVVERSGRALQLAESIAKLELAHAGEREALEEARAWMAAHAANWEACALSWEACAAEHVALLAEARKELSRLTGS